VISSLNEELNAHVRRIDDLEVIDNLIHIMLVVFILGSQLLGCEKMELYPGEMFKRLRLYYHYRLWVLLKIRKTQ